MKHEKEIKYWAEHQDITNVWTKVGKLWSKTHAPAWHPEIIYIVDDEWSGLRKANADGATIQGWRGTEWRDESTNWWREDFYEAVEKGLTPDDFRIKPKEWYERIPPNGVLCRVWDDDQEFERVRVVVGHRPNKEAPYIAVPRGYLEGPGEIAWKHAEPISPDDPRIWRED